MKRSLLKVGLAALLLSFAGVQMACGDMDDDKKSDKDRGAQQQQLTDNQIADAFITINNGEIMQSNLAKDRAEDSAVKDYANKMIEEHTKYLEKIQGFVQQGLFTAEPNATSQELLAQTQEDISALTPLKGKEFDQEFMKRQIKAHQDTLKLLNDKLIPNAKNEELKKLLVDAQMDVTKHLGEATVIQTRMRIE
jgi:putative membrane protein